MVAESFDAGAEWRAVDEDCSRASRSLQTGLALSLQLARDIHAFSDRSKDDRHNRAGLSATAPVRSTWLREPNVGVEFGRRHIRCGWPERANRGDRAPGSIVFTKRNVEWTPTDSCSVGRRGDEASDVEWLIAKQRLGSGIRISILAIASRLLRRRRVC